MTEFATCWGLVGGSLLIASPILLFKITEHSSDEDDLAFNNQTLADAGDIQLQEKGRSDSKDNDEYDSGSQDNKGSGNQEVVETVDQREQNTTEVGGKESTA
jgi:hypothetical protein